MRNFLRDVADHPHEDDVDDNDDDDVDDNHEDDDDDDDSETSSWSVSPIKSLKQKLPHVRLNSNEIASKNDWIRANRR